MLMRFYACRDLANNKLMGAYPTEWARLSIAPYALLHSFKLQCLETGCPFWRYCLFAMRSVIATVACRRQIAACKLYLHF